MIPLRDLLPSQRLPIITYTLIVLNLLVFLFQGVLSTQAPLRDNWSEERTAWRAEGLREPPIFDLRYPLLTGQRVPRSVPSDTYTIPRDDWLRTQYGLIPAELLAGKDLPPTIPVPIWFTLLTSMFLHGGLLHLLGNMLYLWIFGDNVEDAMGPLRFIVFYLLCGLAAAFAQIAVNPVSSIPMVGASGAIAGILAAYFMLYPRARVLTLVPLFFFLRLVAVPAAFLLGFWFIWQVLAGTGSTGDAGGVAFFAHIGGFVAGLFLVFPLRQRHVPVTLWQLLRLRLRPRL